MFPSARVQSADYVAAAALYRSARGERPDAAIAPRLPHRRRRHPQRSPAAGRRSRLRGDLRCLGSAPRAGRRLTPPQRASTTTLPSARPSPRWARASGPGRARRCARCACRPSPSTRAAERLEMRRCRPDHQHTPGRRPGHPADGGRRPGPAAGPDRRRRNGSARPAPAPVGSEHRAVRHQVEHEVVRAAPVKSSRR